jgi:hypothetical protein
MTRDGDPFFASDGRPEASVEFDFDAADPELRAAYERGRQAAAESSQDRTIRLFLEIILQARTPQSRAIRAELLRRMVERDGAQETIPQLAKRLGVTPRRIEQVRRDLLSSAFPNR